MLKIKNFISKYSKSTNQVDISNNSHNLLNSIKNKSNKFHIYNMISSIETNIQFHDKSNLTKYFFISDFYSNYFKLKSNSIINHPFYTNSSSESRKIFLEKFFQLLLEKKLIYTKLEKNVNDNDLQKSNKNSSILFDNEIVSYYLKINNTRYLDQLEKSNEECRLSKQSYKWPNHFINEQEKFINKNLEIKINFEIRDESVKGKEIVKNIFIKVDHPEYLFGVTFLMIKSNGDYFKKFFITKLEKEKEKMSYKLPTSFFAVNPINNEKIPILILDNNHKLAADIETELRVCIPGHNEIDHKLAKEFNFPIKFVAQPINNMASTLTKKMKQSDDIEEILKIKSSSLDDIKKNLKSNESDGPIILKDNEGFLNGCKEFDYLYLNEAKELIVKNLMSKRKAICEKRYEIKDPLIAYETCGNDIMDCDKQPVIIFTPIFELSAELFHLLLEDSKENSSVSLDILKRIFPIDLLININNKNPKEQPINTKSEIIFYSRILYLIILDALNVNKRYSLWNEADMKKNSDDVSLDPSFAPIEELIFSEPFKEILEISDENSNINYPCDNYNDDFIRFNYYLNLNKNNKNQSNQLNDKFFTSLSDVHDAIMQIVTKNKFDLDKVRDEKLLLNKQSSNNLSIDINNIIISIINHIERNKSKLNESAEKMINLIELIVENKFLMQEFPNYFIFLYFNYLLLLYPFCPNVSNGLYEELRNFTKDSFNKESLSEYSIMKLEETCKFFIEMISNTISFNVTIDGEPKGNIIMKKTEQDNKKLIQDIIEEKFGLNNEILNGIDRIEIKDEHIYIYTR